VALAWALDLENVSVIPKATSEAHIRGNWGAYGVALDDEDRERIAALDAGERQVDFSSAPWNN
jgi:2,5-diketo-D-gluconate reductase B